MNLKDILENKELAILKKKSEIQKSDYSNVLIDSIEKAYDASIDKLEVLVYESVINKQRNEEMFKNYLNGWVLNHSVGMRYMKLLFCYNNDSVDYTQEKENFDKYHEFILNKEDVKDYFWAVLEAKNIEASAVVKGSNFLTPVLSVELIDEDNIRVKLAISPSNVLDSHNDVHIPNLWKKAIKETNYDLLLQEHSMSFGKLIADSINDDLKVYTEMISVKELMSKFVKKSSKKEAAKSTSTKTEPPQSTPEKTANRRRILL